MRACRRIDAAAVVEWDEAYRNSDKVSPHPLPVQAGEGASLLCINARQLHPVVLPQVSHLRQVPLRSSVKLPHSPQASPS
jgi:hypothetical protein